MKIFKETKMTEPTMKELINIKLNGEKLERAGFGYYKDLNMYEMVINKSVLVPGELLKLNWEDLRKEILRFSEPFYSELSEAMRKRLDS